MKLYSLYNEIISFIRAYPVRFGTLWFVVFAIFFSGLASANLVPTVLVEEQGEDKPLVLASGVDQYEDEAGPIVPTGGTGRGANVLAGSSAPTRIVIESIGVDFAVVNPTSQDINVLDAALNKGVVHYPGSGNLEDTSNMFLFGHNSGLPVVQNKAYKAFTGVDKLKGGELIRVQSNSKEYLYKVESVSLVDVDETWVELTNREKSLTLSTCNSFGSKQDRYVVKARYIDSYSLI